jgi:hypothetical protein
LPVKIIPKGTRYGRLVATGKYELRKGTKNQNAYFECNCACGNVVWVRGNQLRYGSTLSCGCYGKEQRKKATSKHNLSNTRLYRIWNNMRTRCNKEYSDNYALYGERGISVCEDWDNTEDGFENFYMWSIRNGYSDNLTIDRVDNNGNYCPENCRWVTQHEQTRNKRNNRYYQIDGCKKLLVDIATEHNLKLETLKGRLERGYSLEDALEKETTKKRLIFYKGKFISPKELSEITGVNLNTIESRITKGYTKFEDLAVKSRKVFLRKPVNQYDLKMNYIATYPSASEAARQNNCCKSGVIECCNGKKEKFKGFIYRYV